MKAGFAKLLENASSATILRLSTVVWRQVDLAEAAYQAAGVLSSDGRVQNEFVSIENRDPVGFFILFLACALSGTRFVFPLDRRLGRAAALDISRIGIKWVDGSIAFEPIGGDSPPGGGLSGNLICFSSGSTGPSKGVLHNAETLLANASRVVDVLGRGRFASITALSPFLVSAVSHFLVHWLTESELAFVGSDFSGAEAAWSRRSDWAVVGSPLQLMKHAQFIPDEAEPGFFFSSGDYMYPANIQALLNRFPEASFFNVYGLAELGGRMFIKRLDKDSPLASMASVGQPIAGVDVEIWDEELWVRSDMLFSGYVASDFSASSDWFPTGDLGEWTDYGMRLKGRKGDVVKISGHKVSIRNIEMRISALLPRFQAAVFCSEHRRFGTLLCLALVNPMEIRRVEVLSKLRTDLLAFELPQRIYAVDSIPASEAAKIDRKALRDLAESRGRLL